MSIIRVTKIFTFEMAHALWNYDGPCRNIHGHSYKLFVTVAGEPVIDRTSPKQGMVMDFNLLKQIITQEIINEFDHAFVVSNQISEENIKALALSQKMIILNFQPTTENLLIEFAGRIMKKLPPHIKLFSLRLAETDTSYAEWFASDQKN